MEELQLLWLAVLVLINSGGKALRIDGCSQTVQRRGKSRDIPNNRGVCDRRLEGIRCLSDIRQ